MARSLFFPFGSLVDVDLAAQASTPLEREEDDTAPLLLVWVEAYRKNDDQDAFQKIFEYYRERLWQKLHLRRFYGYEPEDLFQEVNREVARFLKNETPQNLMGLIYRIADRKIVDYLRSKAHFRERKTQVSLEEVENRLITEEANQMNWAHTYDLQRFLFSDLINARQREVLVLYYLLGHSPAEIQALTGSPLNTVKSRLREGLRKLRHYFLRQERQ